jgi:peptidoglycan/xylan/chitin deacetylase (PgdA/CDA1 family)
LDEDVKMKKLEEFNGHKAAFAFRIDLDYFHPKHVDRTLEVAEKHDIKMTWFVNMETGKFHERELRRIGKSQDVQNHGFFHQTFNDSEKNLENLLRADNHLKDMGFGCSGFAAPFGYWNKSLGDALEKAGYGYSSEFREGRGIFPFYKELHAKKAKVLQIPIHPVCLGSLLESGYKPEEAMRYFDKVIDFFYEKQIPIFLYGHPTGRLGAYPKVLDRIFEKVKCLDDVWLTNLTDYAAFWKRKGFGGRKVDWQDHKVFIENKGSLARKAKGLYRGQILRVDKKKIDRRLHK